MDNEREEKEYNRWQGYANALLLAMTVLFAGTAIALPKEVVPAPIISIISITYMLAVLFGLAGIALTVLWFARENKKKIRGKPQYLLFASGAFGVQVAALSVLLIAYLLTGTS